MRYVNQILTILNPHVHDDGCDICWRAYFTAYLGRRTLPW